MSQLLTCHHLGCLEVQEGSLQCDKCLEDSLVPWCGSRTLCFVALQCQQLAVYQYGLSWFGLMCSARLVAQQYWPERSGSPKTDSVPSTKKSIGQALTAFNEVFPSPGVDIWMVGLPVSVTATPVDTLAWLQVSVLTAVNLSWILKVSSSNDVRVVKTPAAWQSNLRLSNVTMCGSPKEPATRPREISRRRR